MPRGGKRPGAGRKKGVQNNKTAALKQAQLAVASNSGETPLEYMLRVMRDPEIETKRRDKMAEAAAPFVHHRLNTIDGNLNHTHRHEDALTELE
jgi:hypothetical protein